MKLFIGTMAGVVGVTLLSTVASAQCAGYTANLHPMNTLEGVLEETTLSINENEGSLENDRFTTSPQGGLTRVTPIGCAFDFAIDSTDYQQVATFHYATAMYDWLVDNGFEEYSPDVFTIRINETSDSMISNALYVPTPTPNLRFGPGDGTVLRNLQQDRDVVAVILANHVYGDAPSTSGDALIVYTATPTFGQPHIPMIHTLATPFAPPQPPLVGRRPG